MLTKITKKKKQCTKTIIIIITIKKHHQELKIPMTGPVYPVSEHPPYLSDAILE